MNIKLDLPQLTDLKPRLTVIGVGGAGCNAVNNMIAAGLTGVEFVVANTDAQTLEVSSAEHRIQLGENLTEGLGAGANPEIGAAAAEEAIDEIRSQISGSHMVFLAAGMGGGTGTGAISVIARASRDLGILTVGVVTKPFQFEGSRRMRMAQDGINELRDNVDTLIVIPNQNLFRVANEKTTFAEAFLLADQVLYSGVACIVDLIVREGLINLDFADVRAVMANMGSAMMGTGEGAGERRAITAAEEAIANPLLDDVSLQGARGLLLSITGGPDLTLYEVDEAASRVRKEVDPEANIIVGATFDSGMDDRVRVSIVASGMSSADDAKSPGSFGQSGGGDSLRTGSSSQGNGATDTNASVAPPVPPPVPGANAGAQRAKPDNSADGTVGLEGLPKRPGDAAGGSAPPVPPANYQATRQPPAENVTPSRGRPPETASQTVSPPAGNAAQPERAAAVPENTSDLWRSPEGVVIETGNDGLKSRQSMPPQPGYGAGETPAQHSAPPSGDRGFVPRQTEEIRRAAPRMPEVQEFPEVGQRDYYAKQQADGGQQYKEEAASGAGRKPGLFERLTGIGRRQGDSPEDQATGKPQHVTNDEMYTAQVRNEGATRRPAKPSPQQSDGSQPSDLPVFFDQRRGRG
ncbi:MAG: cell division protein FtsZ [Alphaproteobacteria bacterium]|nr:cell division protein FtsZ [Alphaproteobacteria bacterium]